MVRYWCVINGRKIPRWVGRVCSEKMAMGN